MPYGRMTPKDEVLVLTLILVLSSLCISGHTAEAFTLKNLPPRVITSIEITQINQSLITAEFNIQLVNANKSADVWIVNTKAEGQPPGTPGIYVQISGPIAFNSWVNSSGTLTSGHTEQLQIEKISTGFPYDSAQIVLYVGSNYSIQEPIVVSGVPTYAVQEHYTDVKSGGVPSEWRSNR